MPTRVRTVIRLGCVVTLLGGVCLVDLLGTVSSAKADETVYACGSYPNDIFYEADAFGFSETQSGCAAGGGGGFMQISSNGNAAQGADSYWMTEAPAGLVLDTASIGSYAATYMNAPGAEFGGGLFWGPDNTQGIPLSSTTGESVATQNLGGSGGFGFQMICETNGCPEEGYFDVSGVTLTVEETVGPSVSGGGLWSQSGWVRGTWPMTVTGDSPSGVCSLSRVDQRRSGDSVRCDGAQPDGLAPVQREPRGIAEHGLAANGADTLSIADSDAAGLSNSASETIKVDNQTPTVSLSGPATALSTAGTPVRDGRRRTPVRAARTARIARSTADRRRSTRARARRCR